MWVTGWEMEGQGPQEEHWTGCQEFPSARSRARWEVSLSPGCSLV